MDKKVSIIMPSLNVAQYIGQCMDSVLQQTLKELEILCIDAGSTDGTLEILNHYAEKDNRIRIVHSSIKSYGFQVNMGIHMAKGAYIAIVETDDYIAKDMMKKLYLTASLYELDYIKSEANGIYVYDSGEIQQHLVLSDADSSIYGRVVNIMDTPQILAMDYYLWRGIYSRNFLVKNHIVCNETKGAAYQDIGFCHLTVLYAKKVMYIPDIFYQYRIGRKGSSSQCMNGLQYTYQEYERLIKEYCYVEKLPERARNFFYTRMAKAFVCEYIHTIRNAGYKLDCALTKYYLWFCHYIQEGIHYGILNKLCFSDREWENLMLLLEDACGYQMKLESSDMSTKRQEESILSQIHTETVIIFGCGYLGHCAKELMYKYGKKIFAFCDNNQKLWNTIHEGIRVITPKELPINDVDCFYIIANKSDSQTIKEQLLELRVPPERIVKYE